MGPWTETPPQLLSQAPKFILGSGAAAGTGVLRHVVRGRPQKVVAPWAGIGVE